MMKMINMACEELKGEIGKWQKVKTDGTNANHARVMDPITSEPPDMLNATQTNQFLKNMFTQYMKAAEADGDIDSLRWWLGEE